MSLCDALARCHHSEKLTVTSLADDINDAEEVDGFEDLTEEDQEKFRKAFDAKQGA